MSQREFNVLNSYERMSLSFLSWFIFATNNFLSILVGLLSLSASIRDELKPCLKPLSFVSQTMFLEKFQQLSVNKKKKKNRIQYHLINFFSTSRNESNRRFLLGCHFTTTTRILFVIPFLFKFCNPSEVWITVSLICKRKQQTEGFW